MFPLTSQANEVMSVVLCINIVSFAIIIIIMYR